jgi:cyclase
MLKKRIIPCLDIQNGRTVKGINFEGIRDAGDPIELAKRYVSEGADELVFLDITATVEGRETLTELVSKVAKSIDIPFTVGGGINSVSDVRRIIGAGADKISINSSAVRNPELIREIAAEFGSQCVVLAMDVKRIAGQWKVFVKGGREETELEAVNWAKEAVELGAGEILLTSMDSDGTKKGFAIEITDKICKAVRVPVIASGGAGCKEDFQTLFTETSATGGLAASIFHYNELPIPTLKNFLKTCQIPIR